MRLSLALSLLGMLVLAGCGENDPFDTEKPRRGPAMGVGGALAPVDLDVQGSNAKPPPPPANTSDTNTLPPPPPPANTNDDQTPPVDPNVERVEAGVGVETKKGQGYGTSPTIMSPITTPVAAYFSIRERIALNQITQGLQHYKALNGHAPKTHEEFMEKIVKDGGVALPELRTEEHRYVYDPETETLMVERPR